MVKYLINFPKAINISLLLAFLSLYGYSVNKVIGVVSVYKNGSETIEVKAKDVANAIRNDEIELSDEKISRILETVSDRSLEDGVVYSLAGYLVLHIFLSFTVLGWSLAKRLWQSSGSDIT